MKITFNDEASGTNITTTPERLNLGNSPDGVVLTFGSYSLLNFKGVTVQAAVPPATTPAASPAAPAEPGK